MKSLANECSYLLKLNMMLLFAVISLLPFISGLLTDPGPLCPGDMATLTCNFTHGLSQQWRYNDVNVGDRISPLVNQVPAVPAVPMVVDGVEFRLSLLSTRGVTYLVSQIVFVASERMDGGIVECGNTLEGSLPVIETATLKVGDGSKFGSTMIYIIYIYIYLCLAWQSRAVVRTDKEAIPPPPQDLSQICYNQLEAFKTVVYYSLDF